MTYTIEQITPSSAEDLCRQITADLPEYFGLPEANEHYAQGVHSRVNFAAKLGDLYVGLLSLEFPYPKNSNIYWMGILRQYQGKGIGQLLIEEAINNAATQNATTMTVETLAPAESDENYLKTYSFYEKSGFVPLFNLKPEGYHWNMVYMVNHFDNKKSKTINPAISIRPFGDKDITLILTHFKKHHWEKLKSTFDNYLQEQNTNKRLVWLAFYNNEFAGYVTIKWESSYSSFNKEAIPEIMDLNVLPPYRNKGIASALLDQAENDISKKSNTAGIGVGLYEGYGNAQNLYIKRGYLPDRLGITYQYNRVNYAEAVSLDDDLVLWFTKVLV